MKFLDSAGLSYLWGKIKDNFANQLKYEDGELYLVDGLGQRLEDTVDTRKFGAISVSTKDALMGYAKAEYLGLTLYLTQKVDSYEAGAYVVTGEGGLLRLATSTATGDINDAIVALEGRVGGVESRIGVVEGKLNGVDFGTFASKTEVEELGTNLTALINDKADASALENYVQKDGDKVLSDINFSADDKAKLDGIDLSLFYKKTETYSSSEIDSKIDEVHAEAIKDSFLKDVDIVDDVIKFTWEMADGSTKEDSVDVSKYIDTYTNGEGLSLSDKTFAVDFEKVASVESVNKHVSDLTALISGKADASSLENYVQKDGDKVLSDNNFSDADKAKLDGIDLSLYYTSAQVDSEIQSLTDLFNGELAKKADAATTLAGYGIADAYTKDEVDGMIPAAMTTGEIDEAIAE